MTTPTTPTRTGLITLRHRWPTVVGIALGVGIWASGAEVTTGLAFGTIGMASLYLVFGVFRSEFSEFRIALLEVAGVAAVAGSAALSLALDAPADAYVLGGAWIGHSAWDFAHHRANRVVPRPYAEICFVMDAIVGIGVLVTV
jgi:hypothetical protein